MKLKNNYITIFIILINMALYLNGCFNQINKHENFINMMLEYYPENKIKILESDPNRLIIQILKGDN